MFEKIKKDYLNYIKDIFINPNIYRYIKKEQFRYLKKYIKLNLLEKILKKRDNVTQIKY